MKKPESFILKASASFDSAHFLYGYAGKCANLHGHRWTIEAEVTGGELYSGMVIDFNDLKREVRGIADFYDHAFIFEKDSLKAETIATLLDEGFRLIELPFRPTAENLAKKFFQELRGAGVQVSRLTVYETPDNSVTYSEE